MAARERNHYIPRFLLKRFASRRNGKKSWVIQIDKSGLVVEPSTADVAVASYFYGQPETGVEDMLGEEETAFREILQKVSDGQDPNTLAQELKEHLWQMVIRTKSIRDQFVDAGTTLVSQVIDTFSTQEARDTLVDYVNKNFETLMETEIIAKLPRDQRPMARLMLRRPEAKAAAIQSMVSRMPVSMAAFRQIWSEGGRNKLERSAQDGQVRGIKNVIENNIVPDTFAPSTWMLLKSDSEDVVLGDVGVFGRDIQGKCGPLIQLGRDWDQLYLPISRSEVLVASKRIPAVFMVPDEINAASARLSTRFVYSAVDTPAVRNLIPIIGADAEIISAAEISGLVTEGMTELKLNPGRFLENRNKKEP